MKRVSRAFASTMNRWRIMLAGFERRREELPFAAEEAEALKNLLKKEEELNTKQELLKGELAKTTQEIYDNLKRGRKSYAALTRYIKAKYGPNSVELKEFIPKGED